MLWIGEPADYSTPFRSALAQITEALGPGSIQSLQLPAVEPYEDFVEGRFLFDGKAVVVYWEHSLSYMSLGVSDMGTLRELENRIRPLVMVRR